MTDADSSVTFLFLAVWSVWVCMLLGQRFTGINPHPALRDGITVSTTEEGGDSETLSNVSVALTTVYIGTKVSCCFLRELGGCRARVMC